MAYESYTVSYDDKTVGYYSEDDDGTVSYNTALGSPWDIEEQLRQHHLLKNRKRVKSIRVFKQLIREENRVPGRKRIIYKNGPVSAERRPRESGERFYVYRRNAEKGEPDYSPLDHDAPHYEGGENPHGMREWACWYAFNKMDDGTYEAALDEAWWWGGSHNDGGTIHREIPEEWFDLPYEEFLENVITLAAAAHYGFTVEQLEKREGLKEFFGFE